MEAFIRIGDLTLTVVENNIPDSPQQHTVVAHDTFRTDGGLEFKAVVLATESEACDLVRDYMLLDGPEEDGLFRKHFPEFCP